MQDHQRRSTPQVGFTLDATVCNQLAEYVENLTSSGRQELDEQTLKQIKKICKTSDEYVKHTYHLLNHQLETDHSEVRLGALLVCDELFRRSHVFRELIVANFQEFLELTVETDPELPLPPPNAAAKKLRRLALDFVQQWHSVYSDGYRKLALGYNFLKECKKVDFRDVQARGVAERQLAEESNRRKENANNENLKRHNQGISDMQEEIDSCLAQINECLRLIVPEPLKLFTDVHFDQSQPCCSKSLAKYEVNKKAEENEITNDWTREHGLVNANFNITVEVPTDELKVRLTTDNAIVMENLRDLRLTVAARFLPAVVKWTSAIIKGSGPADQLKKAIDLKNILENTLKKCEELGVDSGRSQIQAPSDDDDEDFEEVASKEGFEPIIPSNRRAEYGLDPLVVDQKSELSQTTINKDWKLSIGTGMKKNSSDFSDEQQDPTSLVANVRRIEQKISINDLASASTSGNISLVDARKAELLAKAPKLRFDADLVNWGAEDVADPALVIKMDSLHRFWTPFNNDDPECRRKDTVSRHSRVMEFSGDFEPVKWRCRAPLPSGRLCPRQDRHKCPFHGPIIPREVTGLPSDPKDRERLQRIEEEKQQANPDWQDPALLADIKAATGVDLTITKRRGKLKEGKPSKRQKHPGLTNIKAKLSTSRARLEKKVLDRGSVKRVAATLDDLDHKKFTDKFANQFNYSCQS